MRGLLALRNTFATVAKVVRKVTEKKGPKQVMLGIDGKQMKVGKREWGLCDDYEVLHPLGKGSSARVFKGVQVLTGKPVIIKMFKKSITTESIKKEIAINCKLLDRLPEDKEEQKEVRFVELRDTLYEPASKAFTLIYEFYPGAPLNEMIQTITQPIALRTALGVAQTLRYVHSLGLIHRDLKPANILLTPTGPRLFDFGLAKPIDNGQQLKTNNFGTKCYKSPEVIYHMAGYDKSVDVWCLGILMAQMLLNQRHLLPFQSEQAMLGQVAGLCALTPKDLQLIPKEMIEHAVPKGKTWSQLAAEKKLDGGLVDLVRRMLEVNPAKRPSLEQIVKHPSLSPKK